MIYEETPDEHFQVKLSKIVEVAEETPSGI